MTWNGDDSEDCWCQVLPGTPRLSSEIPASVPHAGGPPAAVAPRVGIWSPCNLLQAVAQEGIKSGFVECCISCLLMQLFHAGATVWLHHCQSVQMDNQPAVVEQCSSWSASPLQTHFSHFATFLGCFSGLCVQARGHKPRACGLLGETPYLHV